MALRVAPTPYLTGEDAKKFERKLEEGLKKPAVATPTPKLDSAKKLIKRYAKCQKK
jgi:hypothetical protein